MANKEQIDELEEELYIRGKEEKAAKKAQEEAERLAREAAEESENGS